jgi:hypothetical protein
MLMPNEHRNAEHTNRSEAFNADAPSMFAFRYSPKSWDAPAPELDMFTRWIRLSDKALAAHRHKKPATRGRRKCKILWSAKLA